MPIRVLRIQPLPASTFRISFHGGEGDTSYISQIVAKAECSTTPEEPDSAGHYNILVRSNSVPPISYEDLEQLLKANKDIQLMYG